MYLHTLKLVLKFCFNEMILSIYWIHTNHGKWHSIIQMLWFFLKRMFKPILVFKRNSWVQTTKQHLTPPPPNKERRRGVLLKTRVVAASSQNNYSKEIPLLKLSSTFWVSDIKAKKHHTKLKNLISCILCEREKNSQLADGRCKCKK